MEPFSHFIDAALTNASQCTKNRHDNKEAVDNLLENEDSAEEAVLLEDMTQI